MAASSLAVMEDLAVASNRVATVALAEGQEDNEISPCGDFFFWCIMVISEE